MSGRGLAARARSQLDAAESGCYRPARMELSHLIEGLLRWLALVILFTFHEFGHAWMAMKCGDNTARDEGRVSFNPLVHLDPFGSVIFPLLMFCLPGAGSFLLGWARPVPVNIYNLRNPRIDDVYVTFAGPWMNLIVAVVMLGLVRLGAQFGWQDMAFYCGEVAWMSLLLFFFNLLPIPPLDGSRILRVVIGMSYDTFAQIARYGFFAIIIIMQIPVVSHTLVLLTQWSTSLLASLFGLKV
jgi:Zn-dependent protease